MRKTPIVTGLVTTSVLLWACASDSALTCGSGTFERGGTCVPAPASSAGAPTEPAPAAPPEAVSDLAGCTTLKRASEIRALSPVSAHARAGRPALVAHDRGAIAAWVDSGSLAHRALDDEGATRSDVEILFDEAASGARVEFAPSAVARVAPDRVAIAWTERGTSASVAKSAIVDAGGARLFERVTREADLRTLAAAPAGSGFVTIAMLNTAEHALVAIPHDAEGRPAASVALPSLASGILDTRFVKLVPFGSGALMIAALKLDEDGTGYAVRGLTLDAAGRPGKTFDVGTIDQPGHLAVATSGDSALVAIAESSLDASGSRREQVTVRPYLVRPALAGATAEVMKLPSHVAGAARAMVSQAAVWSGSRFWLVDAGEQLVARSVAPDGALSTPIVLGDAASVTELTAAVTKRSLVLAWSDAGAADGSRIIQSATFDCALTSR